MKVIKKQQGVTMITIALGLVLLGFFVLIAVTIWPVYMENFNINSHLKRLANDSSSKNMNPDEIRKSLDRRFGIDDVKSIKGQDVIISGDSGSGYVVEVDYEVRKSLMGNVDLVIYFNDSVEVN